MADTVKIPGAGPVQKKYVYVGAAVILGIVGYGYYRQKKAAAAAPVVGTQDPNSLDTTPAGPGGSFPTDQFGNPVSPTIVPNQSGGTVLTNLDWISEAQGLDLNIDTNTVTTALANVLAGIPVTQAQADIYHMVVGIIGEPPQGLPYGPPRLTGTPSPPSNTGGGTGSGSGGTTPPTHWVQVVQHHQITEKTGARALVERFSDPGAGPNAIESALRKTYAANPHYAQYYKQTGGFYPAKASLMVTVVKKVA